jgi:hypothetical protein
MNLCYLSSISWLNNPTPRRITTDLVTIGTSKCMRSAEKRLYGFACSPAQRIPHMEIVKLHPIEITFKTFENNPSISC